MEQDGLILIHSGVATMENSKLKSKLRIVGFFFLAVLATALITSSIVQSLYVGNVSEVYVQPPFSEYDYIVGQYNASYYYAQNQTTGNYDWLSSDCYTVIQNALDHSGANVFLRMIGSHTLSHGLVMNKGNQRLTGTWHGSTVSRSTWLTLQAGVNEHVVKINGTINPDYYGLKDITFSTSSILYDGIHASSCLHLELENLQVYGGLVCYSLEATQKNRYINLYASGIAGTSKGFLFAAMSYLNYIQDCTSYNCNTGFYFNGDSGFEAHNLMSYMSNTYNGFFFDNCYDAEVYSIRSQNNFEDGILLYGCYRMFFDGGVIYGNAQEGAGTWSGIKVSDDGAGHPSVNCTLSGLTIYNDTGHHKYAIDLVDASQNVTVIGGCRFGWTNAEFDNMPIVYG